MVLRLSELENLKTEVSLTQFLYKNLIYSGNLHHLQMTNVKNISSHCKRFQLTIFLSQATMEADIFHKLETPLHKSFKFCRPVTILIYPKITLNQSEH